MKKIIYLFLIVALVLCLFCIISFSYPLHLQEYIEGKFPSVFNLYLESFDELSREEIEFIDLLLNLSKEEQNYYAQEVYRKGLTKDILENIRKGEKPIKTFKFRSIKDPNEELVIYKDKVKNNPNDAESYFQIGHYNEKLGKYTEAFEAYIKAIGIKPSYFEVYEKFLFAEDEKIKEAITILNNFIQNEPNSSEAYFHLAELNSWLNLPENIDIAINSYQKAIRLKPNYFSALADLGTLYQNEGNYSKALEYYLQAIKAKPDDDMIYYIFSLLADVYNYLGYYDMAIDSLENFVQLRQDYPFSIYFYKMGKTYFNLQQYDNSIEYFQRAISENPKYADAYYDLGWVYYELDLYEEAITAINQVIKIDPDRADSHYVLGNISLTRQKYNEAISEFKKALDMDYDFAGAHCNLGLTYIFVHKYDEAIKEIKLSIKMDPENAKGHNNLGIAYNELKRYDEATIALKQAIRLNPDFAGAHYNLGHSYLMLEKYDEAIKAFKQSIRIDPDYANAHYALGVVFSYLEKTSSALEEYKILKKLDKDLANELFDLIYK